MLSIDAINKQAGTETILPNRMADSIDLVNNKQ